MAKKIIIWVAVFAGSIVLLFLLAKTAGKTVGGTVVPGAEIINADDHLSGSASAPIKFIEYGDFQCPACAAYFPMVQQLQKEFGDTVVFVFRNFPLRQHPNAVPAAQAAEAAGLQGKYWEMFDMIYENQDAWSASTTVADIFAGYATKIGLNLDQYQEDVNSDGVKRKIDSDLNGGLGFGVNSTPSFFVNGKLLAQPTYDTFKAEFQTVLNTNR